MRTIIAVAGLLLMLGCSEKPHQPAKNPTDNGMNIPQGMPGSK